MIELCEGRLDDLEGDVASSVHGLLGDDFSEDGPDAVD